MSIFYVRLNEPRVIDRGIDFDFWQRGDKPGIVENIYRREREFHSLQITIVRVSQATSCDLNSNKEECLCVEVIGFSH